MRILMAILIGTVCVAAEGTSVILDRIVLTNGRTLVGTISSETDEAYSIALVGGGGGALVIAKDRVVSIERGAERTQVAPIVPVEDQRAVARHQTAPDASSNSGDADAMKQLREEARAKHAVVTAGMMQRVQEKAKINDVIALLGKPGSVERANAEAFYYRWANPDGSGVRMVVNAATQTADMITVLGKLP